MKLIYKNPSKFILALAEFHGCSLSSTFNYSKITEVELETPHNFFAMLYLPIFNLQYLVKNQVKINLKLPTNSILVELKDMPILNEIILLDDRTLLTLIQSTSKNILQNSKTKLFEFTQPNYINLYSILVHVQETNLDKLEIEFSNYVEFQKTKIELTVLQKYTTDRIVITKYCQLLMNIGYQVTDNNTFIAPLYKRNAHSVYADLIYYNKTVMHLDRLAASGNY